MRIGLMMGPERGRYATKVERLRADAVWAEQAGLASIWIPQIPDEFDALTAVTVTGLATERIEIATAVVPVQTRHPVALAQQALATQMVCNGRLTLGLGVSHHWIIDEMLGLPYERPLAFLRDYLDVLEPALRGPGTVDVENEHFRVHNPLDITDITTTSVLLAALGGEGGVAEAGPVGRLGPELGAEADRGTVRHPHRIGIQPADGAAIHPKAARPDRGRGSVYPALTGAILTRRCLPVSDAPVDRTDHPSGSGWAPIVPVRGAGRRSPGLQQRETQIGRAHV